MKTQISLDLILFLSLLFQKVSNQNPIIVIPFKINRIPNIKSGEFNTTNFFQEYFYRDFYTSISTGIPNKNILALLDTHSHIFHFGENYLKRNSLNEILDPEKSISKETYTRKSSLSFKNISRYHYTNVELISATLCSESFKLYTDILLEKGNSISEVKFIIDDNIQDNLHIRLGLGKPMTVEYGGPPHFIQSLLDVGAIKDQTWTFKFLDKNKGMFILGEEPHKYEDITIDDRYQRKNYFVTSSLSSVEYHNPLSFMAQKVYLVGDKEEKININENKGCYLNYNNGFITATKEYWDYIKKNFFGEFLKENICKEELIKFSLDNDVIKSYYVIICDKTKMNDKQKNDLINNFPTLEFFIFDFNYNFEITKDDVFTEVNNILYFMIIYQRDLFNSPELVYWDLGLPFLIKYQFVHSYEKKMIGFYLPESEEEKGKGKETDEKKEEKESKNEENSDNKEDIIENKEENKNLIIYIIVGVIAGVLLLIAAFCLGKYMYQERKRKVNELEENFEYISKEQNKEKEEEGIIN